MLQSQSFRITFSAFGLLWISGPYLCIASHTHKYICKNSCVECFVSCFCYKYHLRTNTLHIQPQFYKSKGLGLAFERLSKCFCQFILPGFAASISFLLFLSILSIISVVCLGVFSVVSIS